MSLMQSFA